MTPTDICPAPRPVHWWPGVLILKFTRHVPISQLCRFGLRLLSPTVSSHIYPNPIGLQDSTDEVMHESHMKPTSAT